MKRAFLICPVRGHDPEETKGIVKQLESEGWAVHWPPRDTLQNDPLGGIQTCTENRAAIENADRVFIVWDENSRGSHFDLGMAFAFGRPITLLSYEGRSFVNVMEKWNYN